jgi:thiamine biosynthesis lipoprotein
MSGSTITSFEVWGSVATIAATDPNRLIPAVNEIRLELADIDRACSRFRPDSDLSRLNNAEGSWIDVGPLLLDAVKVALRGAYLTDGLVDPTVGLAMQRIGYDRDFSEVLRRNPMSLPAAEPAPGWHRVDLREDASSTAIRIPAGVSLDLGATAKAFAADRAAARAAAFTGCGVIVSLGGDVATAGQAPAGGWFVGIADDHRRQEQPGEVVAIEDGGVATSSTTVRRWQRNGKTVHHIVDPRTGEPADEIWRTVSVAAATCVDANIASTAAIVLGDAAPAWLSSRCLPARLAPALNDAPIIRLGAWPDRLAA